MHKIISAEDFAKKSKLYELRSNNQYVFWLESDPAKRSRQYLCCYIISSRKKIIITNVDDYNIKSGINEYGGGSYWLNNEELYFYNKDNNAIYYIDLKINLSIDKISPRLIRASLPDKNTELNYSDGIALANGNFIAVCEFIDKTHNQITQKLVIYDVALDKIAYLDEEHDFYAFPRLNKHTNQLIWISWQHPSMPWDKSILYLAELTKKDGKYCLINKDPVINIDNNSVYQPQWHDNGNIWIVSEHQQYQTSQFWNLYLFNLKDKQFTPIVMGEFEMALPLWQLATNTFVYQLNDNLVDIFFYKMQHGRSILCSCHLELKLSLDKIEVNILSISDIINAPITYIQDTLSLSKDNLYFIGSTDITESSIYQYDMYNKKLNMLNNLNYPVDISYQTSKNGVSLAQEIKFFNKFGLESYAFFYEPNNYRSNKLPPLLVVCHGGPTGTTNSSYNTKIQYWTMRGFAVVDVNYSGSTTYGKQYRDRLKFQWGVIDVADCAAAAQYLVAHNKVDKNNIIIRGTSAGGLIALLGLYHYDIFSAGCCYYPVSDLINLSEQIHNFEKHYNQYLIGDLEHNKSQYILRSPINFADKIYKPVLLFHGVNDKVVPVAHTRNLFNKIKNNHKNSCYIEFIDEGHGFRNFENIKSSLEHEDIFYSRIMGN